MTNALPTAMDAEALATLRQHVYAQLALEAEGRDEHWRVIGQAAEEVPADVAYLFLSKMSALLDARGCTREHENYAYYAQGFDS